MKKLFVIALSSVLIACGGEEKKDEKDKKETASKKITKFSGAEYRYSDSSVEPRYARSWSIKVNGSKGTFVIRSYDDTLIKKEFQLKQEQAELLNKVIPNLEGIEDLTHSNQSGSSAEGLTIYSGKEVVAEAFWDSEAHQSVKEYRLAMKSLVPDFDELMEQTRINGSIVLLADTIPEDVNLEEFNEVAEKYDFKIVPDAESSPEERAQINQLRMKLLVLARGEEWKSKFESENGHDLSKFNL